LGTATLPFRPVPRLKRRVTAPQGWSG
jgi:hypothetical protein